MQTLVKGVQMQEFKTLTVDSFTTPCPLAVKEWTSLKEVDHMMKDSQIRHLPVLDGDGILKGIITERNIVPLLLELNSELKAKDIMVDNPESVRTGSLLSEAVFLMSEKKIGSLLVLDEQGKLDGIFTSTDALNALVEVLRGEVFS